MIRCLCVLLLLLVELSGFEIEGFSKLEEKSISTKGESEEKQLPVVERHKRQLIFPDPTPVQVSFCVASPVDLKLFPFWVNQGFQLNFLTPWKRSQVLSSFLLTPPIIDVARSRNKRDKSNYTQNIFDEFTSESLYYVIENLLESYGYNGTDCLLHTICQLAKIPFQQDEDLIHEILHFILTPSLHDFHSTSNKANESISPWKKNILNHNFTSFDLYIEAELNGKRNENCNNIYENCLSYPLDIISDIEYT